MHEAGLPRFVRVLGLGGRLLTDAVARDLEIPYEQAEALKRQTAQAPRDVAERARLAMARPLGDLVEQIRGSLDYYRGQPGVPRLLRVTLTGGASLTPGLAEQLRDLVGLAVEPASPRDHFEIGDIGFPDDRVETLDPYLPTPAGLALGGLSSGRRINLYGGEADASRSQKRALVIAAVIGVLLLVAMSGLYWVRKSALDTEKDRLSEANARNARLNLEKQSLSEAEQTQAELDSLQGQAETVLASDISWSRMLQEISRTIPTDTWLTAFQGTSTLGASASGSTTPGAATTPGSASTGAATTTTTIPAGSSGTTGTGGSTATPAPTSGTAGGTATFTLVGLDFRSVSSWLQRIGTQIPSFSDLWVSSASRGGSTDASGSNFVNFSSTATITAAAKSDRLEKLQAGK